MARPDEHVHHIACVLHITHGKQVLEKHGETVDHCKVQLTIV